MDILKNRLVAFLRWSEKYTKTDMLYLASGGSWILVGYAVQIICSLVLAIAFANLLPKEAFGTYQFILSGAAILSAFTLTGMGAAISRAAANGSQGSLRYGFKLQMTWSVGIVLAAAITSLYYHLNRNVLLGNGFLLVGALQPLIVGFSLCKPFLQGRQLFRESVVLEISQRVVVFVFLIAAIFLTKDPLILICSYLASNALSLCLSYLFVVKKYGPTVSSDPALKSYGKHLSVMESIAEVANVIDKVLVWVFLGAAPLAIYTIAQMPVMHLQNIFGFMRILVFPKLAKKNLNELIYILPGKIRMYTLVAAVVVAGYILAAPYLFALLFPTYFESVLYSQILALSILAIPRTLIGQAFLAHERKRELYIVNISTPLMRIALLALFLWIWGIWGAVAAILLTEAYAAFLQWRLFRAARVLP